MATYLLGNSYTDNEGNTYYFFQEATESFQYNWTNLESARNTALKSSTYKSKCISYDNKYYCADTAEGPDANLKMTGTVYKRMVLNTSYEVNTKIYIGKITLPNSSYPDVYEVSAPKILYLHTLKYNHSDLFTNTLLQNNKILSSDIIDLITRLLMELERRNKTSDNDAMTQWINNSNYFGGINASNVITANTLTPVHSTLPSITSGAKAQATDINKLVAELENINSNDGWSNATSVSAGSVIKAIIDIDESLIKFELGVDKIPPSGIISNSYHDTGNTSGCAAACRGLCQSCLGENTAESSSGGSACSDGCESSCYGGCFGGCIGGCGSGCFATARP